MSDKKLQIAVAEAMVKAIESGALSVSPNRFGHVTKSTGMDLVVSLSAFSTEKTPEPTLPRIGLWRMFAVLSYKVSPPSGFTKIRLVLDGLLDGGMPGGEVVTGLSVGRGHRTCCIDLPISLFHWKLPDRAARVGLEICAPNVSDDVSEGVVARDLEALHAEILGHRARS